MNQKLQTQETLREEIEKSIIFDVMNQLLSKYEEIKHHTGHQENEIKNLKSNAQLLYDEISLVQRRVENNKKEIYELRKSLENLEKEFNQNIHNR